MTTTNKTISSGLAKSSTDGTFFGAEAALSFIIVLATIAFLVIVTRAFWLWYWRINDLITAEWRIGDMLERIAKELEKRSEK